MKSRLPLLLAVSATLAACAAPAGMSAYRLFDVTGPVVVPGAVAGPTFSLKTMPEKVRVPFELGRLAYIEVWSRKDQGEFAKLGKLDARGDGDVDRTFDPVKLTNLEPRKSYEVQLRAFQVLPEDEVATEVTYVGPNGDRSDSTTAFDTNASAYAATDGANEKVELYDGFKLKLADQDFVGKARGNIDATDGKLKGNGEAMALDAPAVLSLEYGVLNYWSGPNNWYVLYYNTETRFLEIKTGNPLVAVASGTLSTTSTTTALSSGSLKVDTKYQATWTLNNVSRTFILD